MPSEAVQALLEGVDSPSIRKLAGMTSAESDEVRATFRAALHELDIEIPSPREAAILVATQVATQITQGAVTPYEGARQIWAIARRLPRDHVPELDTFVYGASEWEERPDDQKAFAAGIMAAAHDLLHPGP